MKMKCLGGLSNGQIVDVDFVRHREGDQVRVPVERAYELTTFQQDLQSILDDTGALTPYDFYQVCAIHWMDEGKFKRSIYYLCPIKWNKFEALAYAIGA